MAAEVDGLPDGLVMGAARRRNRDDVRPTGVQRILPVGTRVGDAHSSGHLANDIRRAADDANDFGAGGPEGISMALAGKSGAKVNRLRGAESTTDRTRKAVALFAALDTELRANGSSIDALSVLLMRHETTTLLQLRADARKLLGRASTVLAAVE